MLLNISSGFSPTLYIPSYSNIYCLCTRPTKRKKVRIVDFGDTLTEILRNARKEQLKNRMQYGALYYKNYYREVKDKNRVYYEFYHLDGTEEIPDDHLISFH